MQGNKRRMTALAAAGILAVCLASGCGRENDGTMLDEIRQRNRKKRKRRRLRRI